MTTPFEAPITLAGVTSRIEALRAESGRDAQRLSTLTTEFVCQLRSAAPEGSFLPDYAEEILEGDQLLSRYGFFLEVG